jgi:hypothetical protein
MLLFCWKCVIFLHDTRECKRFEKEIKSAKWKVSPTDSLKVPIIKNSFLYAHFYPRFRVGIQFTKKQRQLSRIQLTGNERRI